MSEIEFVRVLRTVSSERFLLRRDNADLAGLDLHFLADGEVDGLLLILAVNVLPEDKIPELLADIDRRLLGEAAAKPGRIHITVAYGRLAGNFEPGPA